MAVFLTLDNENLAKTYEEISGFQFDVGRLLVEDLEIKPGDAVLDIGCGTGRLGRHVAQLIGPAGLYIGIDPLADRVKIAKEKNRRSHAVHRVGSAGDLSFVADDSIDAAVLNEVFHWIVDKEPALREIRRVLRPGGKLGLTTGAKDLNSTSGVEVIVDAVLRRPPYREAVRPDDIAPRKHGVTKIELEQLLVRSGFALLSSQVRTAIWPYHTTEEVFRFAEASSFGNVLTHVPSSLRQQALADIDCELRRHEVDGRFDFPRHNVFTVAQKQRHESQD